MATSSSSSPTVPNLFRSSRISFPTAPLSTPSSRLAASSPCAANAIPVPKDEADLAMDAAQCIGCGACVAACKNASAMLFVSAKVGHLGLLPQGQAERDSRVLAMVSKMDELGFGNCTNQYECSAACPKLISHDFIARMNRDYISASFRQAFKPKSNASGGGA